jgi:phage gpG-like protein
VRPQWDGWQRRVAKALRDPRVRDGIAMSVQRYAKAHIAKSEGRGDGGRASQLAPLKPIQGKFWTKRKPPADVIPSATRERIVTTTVQGKDGKVRVRNKKITEYLMTGESYRAGGQPLRDTGNLQRSITAKAALVGPTRVEVTLAGALYGIFHELGFSTSGPNFIPLTRKGKREHATGRNPYAEGLTRGKDFIMAWNGVEVQKRPFLVPTNTEWAEIGRSIRLGLARILKGR